MFLETTAIGVFRGTRRDSERAARRSHQSSSIEDRQSGASPLRKKKRKQKKLTTERRQKGDAGPFDRPLPMHVAGWIDDVISIVEQPDDYRVRFVDAITVGRANA